MDRFQGVRSLYQETLETRRRTLGDEHADTLSSMNELAALHVRQAIGTRTALRDPDPDTRSLFARQKDECDRHCSEVMEICVRELGPEHPITLESIHLLAAAHELAERYDDAARLFEQALDARERVLGDEHPDTLRSMEQLVMVYRNQGRASEADPLGDELRARRRSRAEQENASPMDKNQHAWALLVGRKRDEEEALRLSLETTETTHYKNAMCLDTLAHAYFRTGDRAKAIETQKSAMALLSEDETDFRAHMERWLAKFEAALAN